MPHSLRVRLKNLQRKGELTERDIDRIFKALDQKQETGYWIDGWLNEYKSCPIVICSKCGMGGVTAYKEFSYCPNCGAKMQELAL